MLCLWFAIAAFAEEPRQAGTPPPSAEECPEWIADAPDYVCKPVAAPTAPSPLDADAARVRRALDVATAGTVMNGVAIPTYLTTAFMSVGTHELALGVAMPLSGLGGAGTVMSAVGQSRANHILAAHGVRVSPAAMTVGAVLGGLGFALEAGGTIAWGGFGDNGAGISLAAIGLGLHTGSMIAFSVGDARTRAAVRRLAATDTTQAGPSRPQLRIAPQVDLASGTIGIQGAW